MRIDPRRCKLASMSATLDMTDVAGGRRASPMNPQSQQGAGRGRQSPAETIEDQLIRAALSCLDIFDDGCRREDHIAPMWTLKSGLLPEDAARARARTYQGLPHLPAQRRRHGRHDLSRRERPAQGRMLRGLQAQVLHRRRLRQARQGIRTRRCAPASPTGRELDFLCTDVPAPTGTGRLRSSPLSSTRARQSPSASQRRSPEDRADDIRDVEDRFLPEKGSRHPVSGADPGAPTARPASCHASAGGADDHRLATQHIEDGGNDALAVDAGQRIHRLGLGLFG